MATEAELAPRPSAASASLADDDLKRILEFDRIVKLSEAITSGKHPRIKIPPHLVRSSPSTTTPVSSKEQSGRGSGRRSVRGTTAAAGTVPSAQKAALLANGSGVHDTHLGDNLAAFGQNSQMLVEATVAGSLPGLGAASGVRAISPSKVSPDEIPLQRARVEALIREQAEQRAKIVVSDPAHIDFIVGDVLQKARELQRTFTPPPVAILTQDDMSGRGDASARPRANVASSSAAVDSVDDQTFYSSNFSTPEFALTSRIPIDEDNDDVSMHGSSNYEPELDSIPSPKLPSQPQPQSQPQPHLEVQPLQLQAGELQQFVSQQPTPEQLAPLLAQISNRTPAEILTSLLGPNYDPNTLTQPPLSAVYQDATQIQATDAAALLAAWGKHLPGLSGLPQPGAGAGASTSAHQQVAAGNPKPSSPFVRTHDLSPIAPQPAHISSLAVAAQLPLAVEGQQNTSQGTFAQVALLRRGEASQSSPDSSPYNGGHAADKRKGKKKATGKRKADINQSSPRIKLEPKSPSPILAPLIQRPHKRQRQEGQTSRAVAYGYDDDDAYSPPPQTTSYAPTQPAREAHVPVVYERVEGGRYVQQPRYGAQRDFEEVYESAPPGYSAVRQVQPDRRYPTRPPSAHHIVAQSQVGFRSARAATHTLMETSPGHPFQHARAEYAPGAYEAAGMSTRPVAMAPPPTRVQHISPPTSGRIVVDEFNREYYEPAPHQPAVVETVAYDPNVAYERPASRPQHAQGQGQGQGQRYSGYPVQQAPQASYDDEIVYQRTSPTYAPPRRVVTQPEYVTREPAGFPLQEYSARPTSQYPAGGGARPGRTYVLEAPGPAPGYLPRASTVRPPEAAGYEVPPAARYVERVGSDRPPPDGGGAYSAARGYGERPVMREYSTKPDPHVVVHRAYSVRPPPAPAYYADQGPYVVGGPPAEEYEYPEGSDVYR